jgi:hypothetical protein
MSDHLTRLAARALGLAETVRPRRILFEPQPVVPEQLARSGRATEQRPPVPTVPAEEVHPAEPVVVPAEPHEEAARAEAVKPTPIAGEEREHASPQPLEAPAPAPSEPPPTLPRQAVKPEQAVARGKPAAPARLPADRRIEHVADVVAQPVPLRSTRPEYRWLRPEREQEQPPTVRVTIGRVDVRAVAPEKPVERRPKQQPRMSLDEYLSRNRSAR